MQHSYESLDRVGGTERGNLLRPLRHRDFRRLWTGMTLSLIGDGAFLVAMTVLGVEPALYSILTYVSAARTLEFILHGIEEFTAITIMSGAPQPIREAIIAQMGRTVTVYQAHGGRSGEDREILYCVVTRLEIGRVMRIIDMFDTSAFIVQHPVADVRGGVVHRHALP